MSSTKFILGMRDQFFEALFKIAQKDKDLMIVSADNGAPSLDQFAYDLDNQFVTVGIAEQQMQGLACGLATEGKIVYTYAIAPFVTARIFEQNKIAQCAMNLPIINVGIGAGYGYAVMGPSHHNVEDISIMRSLPNMKIYSPCDGTTAAALAEITYRDKSPQYIRLDRAGIPEVYLDRQVNFEDGVFRLREGADVAIVATGITVHNALKAAEELEAKHGIRAAVIDLMRLKPVNHELLFQFLNESRTVVAYEEHLLAGGMGSILSELFTDHNYFKPLLRIGQNDRFVFDNGGREAIWEKYGLDVASVVSKVASHVQFAKSMAQPAYEFESGHQVLGSHPEGPQPRI